MLELSEEAGGVQREGVDAVGDRQALTKFNILPKLLNGVGLLGG